MSWKENSYRVGSEAVFNPDPDGFFARSLNTKTPLHSYSN